MEINNLPNEIELLKKLLILKDQELKEKDQHILELKDVITILQRKKFAPSSESNKDQLNLFNEIEDIIESDVEEDSPKELVKEHERKPRGKRKPLPENLKRIDIVFRYSRK